MFDAIAENIEKQKILLDKTVTESDLNMDLRGKNAGLQKCCGKRWCGFENGF